MERGRAADVLNSPCKLHIRVSAADDAPTIKPEIIAGVSTNDAAVPPPTNRNSAAPFAFLIYANPECCLIRGGHYTYTR